MSVAKSERESAWAPALHRGHQEPQDEELRGGPQQEAVDRDAGVDGEGQEDGPLRPHPVGEQAEGERERHAHQLHHEQRQHHLRGGDADLVAVGGGHADDRVDRVVVDEEREQQQPGVAVVAQVANAASQPSQGGAQRALPGCLAGVFPRPRLGDVAEERDREEHPPHGHAQEREPGGGASVGEPERGRARDHPQVEGEEQAAAEVAHGEARGRDPVHLALGGDPRQERVVEGEGGCDAHVRDHEGQEGVGPPALRGQRQPRGRGRPQCQERREEGLLAAPVVGHRPQEGAEQADDHHGDRRGEREARARGLRGEARGRDPHEVDREDHEHGRHEGGVRHVVERPRPQLAAVQPQPVQPGGVGHGRQAYPIPVIPRRSIRVGTEAKPRAWSRGAHARGIRSRTAARARGHRFRGGCRAPPVPGTTSDPSR